jgi:hypothetical protein
VVDHWQVDLAAGFFFVPFWVRQTALLISQFSAEISVWIAHH